MLTLEKTQQAWLDNFIYQSKQLNTLIKQTSLLPEEQIVIYRNNLQNNLTHALKITFPGIWSLLGDECANLVAKRFILQKKHLPKTGCLDDWGHLFPKFLGKIKGLKQLDYLYDYALLEWLLHLSYCARTAKALTIAEWQEHANQGLDNAIIRLHPSAFLFKSRFSLAKIHELLINPDSKNVCLHTENTYAMIVYHTIYWVSAPLWHFLLRLKQGHPLITALEKNIADFPEFNLIEALQFLLENKMICNVVKT